MKVIDGKILCKKELPKIWSIINMTMPSGEKPNGCDNGYRSCGNLVSKYN